MTSRQPMTQTQFQREVYNLRHKHGWSIQQIIAALAIDKSYVYRLIRRERLRREKRNNLRCGR